MTTVALTGTPGTGKTSVARALAARPGVVVLEAAALADDCGALEDEDERGARVVDEEMLADCVRTVAPQWEAFADVVVVEAHFAHDLPADVVVVLRCHPDTLVARLKARGWSEAKVRENVEAEAMGIIAWEVLDDAARPVMEVDTTGTTPDAVADLVGAAAEGHYGPQPDPGRWDVASLPWL